MKQTSVVEGDGGGGLWKHKWQKKMKDDWKKQKTGNERES